MEQQRAAPITKRYAFHHAKTEEVYSPPPSVDDEFHDAIDEFQAGACVDIRLLDCTCADGDDEAALSRALTGKSASLH